jgi:uncharacterized protein (DUF305 family)
MTCKSPLQRTCLAIGALAFVAGILPAFAQAPSPAGTSMDKKDSMKGMSMDKKDSMKPGMSGMAAGGDMHGSMMGMMKSMESMKTTGDPDRDFAMMMKMHHQGAIDMAQMELKSGKDASLKAMAKKIIAAQQKEIKEFDQWLAKHK